MRIQLLESVEGQPGMYILLSQCGMYKETEIEHTFSSVPFTVTTTYELTQAGARRKAANARTAVTCTKEPLDVAFLSELLRRAQST